MSVNSHHFGCLRLCECLCVCVNLKILDWISQKLLCKHHTEFLLALKGPSFKEVWIGKSHLKITNLFRSFIFNYLFHLFYLIKPSRWWRECCPIILISQWTSKMIVLKFILLVCMNVRDTVCLKCSEVCDALLFSSLIPTLFVIELSWTSQWL